MGKIVMYPKRGMVQITTKSKYAIANGKLQLSELQNGPHFIQYRSSLQGEKDNNSEIDTVDIDSVSAQDLIDSGFSKIETELKINFLID